MARADAAGQFIGVIVLLAFTMLLFVVTFALTTWSERRRRGRGLAEDPLVLTGPAEGTA